MDKVASSFKDHQIILQISDEKENGLRDEINGFKLHLKDENNIEEEMRNWYRGKGEEFGRS